MASLGNIIKLLSGAAKAAPIIKDTLEAGAQGPRVIPTAMRDVPGLFKTITGIGKTKQLPEDVSRLENFAATRGALPGALKYNPLVSTNAGRITAPRIAAGLGLGALGFSKLASGLSNGTTSSQLTTDQLAQLNAANNAGSAAKLRDMFMPAQDTSLLTLASMLGGAGATSTGGAGIGAGGYSSSVMPSTAYGSAAAGMNAGATGDTGSGYSGMTPVSGALASAPGTAQATGSALDSYLINMANAQDTTGQTAAAIKGLSQSSKDKYVLAALAAQQQAQTTGETDYRNYLLKNAIANPNLYASAAFTGNEAGLSDVYKQWNAMPAAQKELLARTQGIYTPQDYYSLLKANNPSQYGG